jgi:tight adherence protein C
MSLTETVLDPNNMLTALVGIVTFATILTLASPLFGRGTLEKRMKLVTRHRDDLRRQSREALAKKGRSNLRHTDEGFFKGVVDALKLRRLLEDP